MARILFFGKLADAAGARMLEVSLEPGVRSVDDLVGVLGAQGDALSSALNESSVRFIVNEVIVSRDFTISDQDEIAFLPPVSGG